LRQRPIRTDPEGRPRYPFSLDRGQLVEKLAALHGQ